MTGIKANPMKLSDSANGFKKISHQVNSLNQQIQTCMSGMDWEIRGSAQIEYKVSDIRRKLDCYCMALSNMSNYLDSSSQEYQKCEKEISGYDDSMNNGSVLGAITYKVCWYKEYKELLVKYGVVGVIGGVIAPLAKWIENMYFSWVKDGDSAKFDAGNSVKTTNEGSQPGISPLGKDGVLPPSHTTPAYIRDTKYYSKNDFIDKNERVIDDFCFNDETVNALISKENVGDTTYSKGIQCSDYVKRFYAQTYKQNSKGDQVRNVIINSLLYNGYEDSKGNIYDGVPHYSYTVTETGKTFSGDMQLVTEPQAGDIFAAKDGEHWAIVKAIDGENVIVIEQNYGYNDPKLGWTVPINRSPAIEGHKFYRIPQAT